MAVSLTPPVEEGTINLQTKPRILKDEGVLRSRIQKADYALGEDSPGQEEISADFWLGMEDRVREQAALSEATRMRTEWQQSSADIVRGAAQEGRPLNELEQSYVLDRPTDEVLGDRNALEKRYARRTIEDTIPEAPDFPEVSEEARSVVTKQQIAQRIVEDIQQKYNDTSWASWGADLGKSIVPGYSWWKKSNRIEGIAPSSTLTGSSISEQMRGLYFLPAEEFEARLKEAVDTLAEDNIIEALEFAQAATSYSASDELLDNLFFGLDAVDVATLGGAVAARALIRGSGRAAVSRKAKDVITETLNPEMTSVDRMVVGGDVKTAAEEAVRDRLSEIGLVDSPNVPGTMDGTRPERVLNELAKTGPGIMDPENYLRSAGSLSNERQRRLLESLERNRDVLKSSLTDVTHIVRVDDAAATRGFQEAEAEFKRTYFRLEDSIVEVKPVRESVDVFGGTDYIEITLGKKDATAFKTAEQAEFYAKNMYRLPEGGYDVTQKGGSYFLRMERSIDETSSAVMDLRLSTNNQAPETFANTWMGWLRNPDDVRSREASAWAKQATYGGNAVMSKMSEVAKSIGALSKNEGDRVGSIINEARFKKRQVLDPATGQMTPVTGKFYHDVAELEKAYMDKGYSLPSDKEIAAYFSFRQIMDYDYAVRNVSVYRDKARLGVNQKQIGWIHVDEAGKKQYKNTGFFEGRTIQALPSRSGEPFTIGWYNGTTGKARFGVSSKMFGRDFEEIDSLLANDYKIIQVADPKAEALRESIDTGGEPIQYLIVRDMKEKPLSNVQVPWNEGGHWIYPQTGYYLKQPQTHKTKFGRRIYDGDVTAHYFVADSQGKQFASAYEEARRLMNDNSPDLDAFVQRNLPYTGDEFRALFRAGDNEGAFDPNTPFVLTQSGQRSADVLDLRNVFSDEMADAGSSEHSLLGRMNTQYAQERGERLTSIKQTGTEVNPTFKLTGAPVMDAMDALARSSAQLAKSRFFDDYKHRVVEDFVSQFADTMDVSLTAFRADPMRYIREPLWKKDFADGAKMAAARNNRRALMYLLGQETNDARALKWTKQKLIDGIFKAKGKDSTLIDPWRWDSRTDPATVARSAVFHTKLGLLNVVQFPLQAQAVLHAAAIDGNPIRAAQANFLYWSMRMRGLAETNRGAQGFFGRAASKALGVDQSTVDEMYAAFKSSGMDIMEGEYARLDDYLNPREFYKGGIVNQGLDAGTFFFKEGNLTHRGVSFATAFLRWKSDNPGKRLNATEMRKISERADLYYVNMSRASNNDILSGGTVSSFVSLPTQFMTFHKNLMEQLLSTRLTGLEKARMMTMYSAVYGVPTGVGLAVAPIWPVHESVNQYMLENGIDTDSNAVSSLITKGVGQMAIEMLTGEDMNFAERYGPGGLSWLRDLLDGNLFEVVGGASGSSLADAYERLAPFGRALVSVFSEDDYYPLTKEDFLDAAREISSINNVARAYFAVTTGQYLTKSDRPIMNIDADGVDAVMMVLGLSPQEVSDTYLMIRSMKQEDSAKEALSQEILKQFGRGAKASADGDPKMAEQFYRKAHHIMTGSGFTPQERGELFRRAVRDNQTLLDKVDRNFMVRDPDKRMQPYLDREVN